MPDSSEGLRSIIGRKLVEQLDTFDKAALVQHCKNPEQLRRGCSKVDRNQLECQRRSNVDIVDADLCENVICEIELNFNFGIPIREVCQYGTISTSQLFVKNAAG